jgi:hypothetical protein
VTSNERTAATTTRPTTRPGRLVRAAARALAATLLALTASVALPATANAHADHGCTGKTGSGFSCTRTSAASGNLCPVDYQLKPAGVTVPPGGVAALWLSLPHQVAAPVAHCCR